MTDIPTPQEPLDPRGVMRSIGIDGKIAFSQVGFQELDFAAVFGGKTTSSSENTIGFGTKTFSLDTDDGKIAVGYTVQIISLDDPDCFMYGFVTRKGASPVDIDVAISVTSALINTSSNWEIQIIAGTALGFEGDTLAISISSVSLALGETTFVVEEGKFLPESASVLARDLTNIGNYLYGRIVAYSGTTIVVNVLNVFGSGSSSSWAIRLLDGPLFIEDSDAEDWGFLSDIATETYGSISVAASSSDDYGLVTDAVTLSENYGAL